jgi:hypothetical protein
MQMVLQFACSKAGLILYRLDPELATTDPELAKDALRAALTLTRANILVSQEAGSDVNYIRLAQGVIPELRIFDTANGMPFVTPRFPHLRLAIQTGYDQDDKHGWFRLHHMLVPSGNLETFVGDKLPLADAPLCGELVLKDNIPVDKKLYSITEVVEKNMWPTFVKIFNKNFHEVEGVGVVF